MDWQITLCFYSALHLIKSHLAHNKVTARTHDDVSNFISNSQLVFAGIVGVPKDVQNAYTYLYKHSREARYLFPDGGDPDNDVAPPVFSDADLIEAVRRLNSIMKFYQSKYGNTFKKTAVTLQAANQPSFDFFDFENGKPSVIPTHGPSVATGGGTPELRR